MISFGPGAGRAENFILVGRAAHAYKLVRAKNKLQYRIRRVFICVFSEFVSLFYFIFIFFHNEAREFRDYRGKNLAAARFLISFKREINDFRPTVDARLRRRENHNRMGWLYATYLRHGARS